MTYAPKLFVDELAARLKARAGTVYRPANGFEGDMFVWNWCHNCSRDNYDSKTGEGGCDIFLRSMAFDAKDEGYPTEMQYSEEGQPACKGFSARPAQ